MKPNISRKRQSRAFLAGLYGLPLITGALLGFGVTSNAQYFVPVSLSPIANELDDRCENMPVGQQVFGGVPFDIPSTGNDVWDSAVADPTLGVQGTVSATLNTNIYGASSVYTLINTGWGVANSKTVSLQFVCSDGFSYTDNLTESVDIRDWLDNTSDTFNNSINGTTTTNVWSGTPNASGGPYGWIDMQNVALPSGFATRTLTEIIITDSGVTGSPTDGNYSHQVGAQRSFIYGATVETALPAVSVTATIPEVTLGSGKPGQFTLTIPTALPKNLDVFYTLKGTAVNGTDYEILSGSKNIKAGKTKANIEIVPIGNLGGASEKTVKLVLVLKKKHYTVATAGPLKVKILAAP